MVFLNNKIEKSEQGKKHQTETVISMDMSHAGIAPLVAQIPDEPVGSLPIKLISNLNSNFLFFVNFGYEFKNEFRYIMMKRKFVKYVNKIQRKKLISYLITAKSKDIQ